MRILLLCHSFNSLTQRLFVELRERGEDVSVEYDISDDILREAVELFAPDLILAPFLKRAIPADVLAKTLCLVIHPGPPGDRGPSALDWALLEARETWGVTLLEAAEQLDAGAVWAQREFPLRAATKSSIYRHEVTRGAVACVLEALAALREKNRRPPPPENIEPMRPFCKRADRKIDFVADGAADVLRKIRSADGSPGAPAEIGGRELLCFDAHPAPGLNGPPGEILARSNQAIAVAARDGAVWIGHLREFAGRLAEAAGDDHAGEAGRWIARSLRVSCCKIRTGGRRRLSAFSFFERRHVRCGLSRA